MLEITKSEVETLIQKHLDKIINIRHQIHRKPETGHNEYETCNLIRNTLKNLNIEILPNFLKTDTVAFINRNKSGKNVTLRADIDALNMSEKTGLNYSSSNKNVMHACGHDGHTAIMLGTAMILNELKTRLNGSVRLVFQPAEEGFCGGRDLVNAGALDNPVPDICFALHGWPKYKVGSLSTKKGYISSACDTFEITIKGKGGHGAMPEKCNNPILIATKVVDALNQIATTKFNFMENVLISICKIEGGTANNVIPDIVKIEGTTRYYDISIGEKLSEYMEDVISGVCNITGADYVLNYAKKYIPMYNDGKAVDFWTKTLKEYFEEDFINSEDSLFTGSEDFSFFLQKAPGLMFKLGLGEDSEQLHSPYFNFNDKAIKNGIKAFTLLTLKYLK